MKQIPIFLLTLTLLTSCGGESDESSSSSGSATSGVSNPIVNAFETVTSQADDLSGAIPLASQGGASAGRYEIKTAQGFSTDWTTVNGFIDERDSTTTSAKEWMGVQLDADSERSNGSKISPFGRFENALGIFCAVGVGLGSSNSYPSNGNDSITLDSSTASAIESQCEMEIEAEMLNQSVSITVEDTTDTTYYDKKFTITIGGNDQVYYIRSDSSEINIATAEDNSYGISRTVVAYNLNTQVLKMEYVSGPDALLGSTDEHVEAFRLYHDETNDKGYLMGMKYDDKSIPEKTHYILAARPESIKDDEPGETVALSMVSNNFSDSNGRQACIDASNGNIDTDNSLNCSITGIDVDATNTGGEDLVDNYDNSALKAVSESSTLTFTDSTFATTSFSEN